MSTPVNFNTASFEELKTVLSKNKSHAVLEAREKAGGHLTIKAFRSATKMSQNAFQKMVNEGAIVYEVESSMQTPSQVTPPPLSEENSPPPTGEDQSVQGATAMIGESGFQLMPAKLPFTPSGPPYIDNPGGGPMPANGVLESNNTDPSSDNGDTGNHPHGHRQHEPPPQRVEIQSPQKVQVPQHSLGPSP